MMRLLVLCATLDVSLGAGYSGSVYASQGENANVCPDGTTEPQTQQECDAMALAITTDNIGSEAYNDLLEIGRAAEGTTDWNFHPAAMNSDAASFLNLDSFPSKCIMLGGEGDSRGSIYMNPSEGTGAVAGYKICCIAAQCPGSAGASGDPHFTGADNDKFDFKGKNNTIYNLVSASRVTLNALFQHKTYKEAGPKHREVHGSYMTAGFAAIKTNADRLLHIGYDATRAVFIKLAVNGTEPTAYKAPLSMTIDDVSMALAERVATITTPEWTLSLSSKFKAGIVAAGNTCADGKCFLEVKVSPRVDVAKLKVAPHGLIGQTYDGDGVRVIGKTDDYKTRNNVVTTSAMGEGAIEGEASYYEMASEYATEFEFSRFGLTEAKPRDATKLNGQKVGAAAKAASAGAV